MDKLCDSENSAGLVALMNECNYKSSSPLHPLPQPPRLPAQLLLPIAPRNQLYSLKRPCRCAAGSLSAFEKTISKSSNQHLIWKKVEVVLRIIYPEKANIGETNGSQA